MTPIAFFTNASDQILKTLNPPPSRFVPLLSVTNVQVWPTNRYTPAVHRAFQLAANLYDASTNWSPSGFPFYPRDERLLEVPITTTRVLGQNLPTGGGGYFRLLPYAVYRWALRRVNRGDGQPGVFYCHPWEIDPDQPRQRGVSWKTRFRHYTNLGRMEGRLRRLLRDFSWGRMDEVFLDQPQRREGAAK